MIRLYIIEDHPPIIAGLRNMFRSGRDNICIAGSAENMNEAITNAEQVMFDIFILDLWLPSGTPLDNVKLIKSKFPFKPVVVYTSEESSLWQRRMYKAGVAAYILKTMHRPDMKVILEKVAAGESIYPGSIKKDLQKKVYLNPEHKQFKLNSNQQNIISLLSKGYTYHKIAGEKKVSESTIEKTVKHIRELFDAKNNSELIRILSEENKDDKKT
jgi:DNA-binding NarL/FixJ family response regulator